MAVRRDLERKMLHGVDGLTVSPDEQAHVIAMENGPDVVGLLDDLDLGIQCERFVDVLEQFPYSLRRGRLLPRTHRRLPDRFFFLRGDRGGGVAGLRFSAVPEPPPLATAAGRLAGAVPSAPPLLPWSIRSMMDIGGPASSSDGGRIGPSRLRTIVCWTIVQKFVVIQYTSRPAGKLITKITKTNGSARKMIRWVRSVAVDIRTVESSCDPT